MSSSNKVVLSALTPSNRITIGNYLGALKNWVHYSQTAKDRNLDCLFFVVDLHALTERKDPKLLKEYTYSAVAFYLACGLDPESSLLFVQSHVPAHAQLCWILTCHTHMGELGRMTQFKDKSQKHGESIPAGLFSYPVLMAADILLYQTDLVPVGMDQKQHVELTRDLAQRMNHLYGDVFKIPEPWIPPMGAKIMSLQNPTQKMSKSDPDPLASVFLDDSKGEIEKKFKRAVTDSLGVIADHEDQPGVRNLLRILSSATGQSVESWVQQLSGKQYGHLKAAAFEVCYEKLGPIQAEAAKYLSDRGEIDRILKKGAEKASLRAEGTMKALSVKLGLI